MSDYGPPLMWLGHRGVGTAKGVESGLFRNDVAFMKIIEREGEIVELSRTIVHHAMDGSRNCHHVKGSK